ncbi:hypothetical protein RM697_10085 [Ichthyenterobacterium sp. W332]|uniref:Uncharacterized protein n=1 Tax=Microcosmobacter mediterraneus TaxID=3075607 RepID=A0ABU2YLG8_9FLAO|nr:hypothetical protein [Ichthyenterobacterium sp. W332]MDT0558998.1 hypothetical protein [Ichthyenterobacterium sp. W332]
MNSSQRKWHGFVWLLIVLIVPAILFLSVKDLNLFTWEATHSEELKSLKSDPISVAENNLVKLSLFESSVEIILKKTLKHPSSVIYEIDAQGNKGQLIGQLTTVGLYNFNITELPYGILIYDSIKETEITKLLF